MSVIDELVTLLGLDIAPDAEAKGTAFERMLGRIEKAALVVGGALATAAGAVEAYAMHQAEAIEKEGRFADSIGVSYQRLQELDYATTVLGGSTQELHADLLHLTKTMNSPIPGEYNQTLYMLGISARDASGHVRKADELLMAVGDKLATMGKQRQLQFADRLGISAGTLTMLRAGRVEVQRLAQEAELLNIVLSDEAKEKATVFEKAYRRMTAIVHGLGRSISVGLLPGLTTAADSVSDWVVANNKLISTGITQFIDGVGQGFKLAGDAVRWAAGKLSDLVGPLGLARDHLDATRAIAVATALALGALAIATLAAAWPYIVLAAAVGAVVLVVEDLYTWFKGGKSVVGEWVDEFAKAHPVLTKFLVLAGHVASVIGGGLWDAMITSGKAAWSVLVGVNNLILSMVKSVANLVDGFLKLVGIFGTSDNMNGGAGQGQARNLSQVNDLPVPSAALAAAMAGRGGRSGGNTFNFEINGAGDPAAVGADVASRAGLASQTVAPGTFGPMGAN